MRPSIGSRVVSSKPDTRCSGALGVSGIISAPINLGDLGDLGGRIVRRGVATTWISRVDTGLCFAVCLRLAVRSHGDSSRAVCLILAFCCFKLMRTSLF